MSLWLTNMDQSPTEAAENSVNASQSTRWETPLAEGESTSPGRLSTSDENGTEQDSKPSAPVQKRRRVTRACDECRRKKIKCDGKQPCTHCTVYSYGRCSVM